MRGVCGASTWHGGAPGGIWDRGGVRGHLWRGWERSLGLLVMQNPPLESSPFQLLQDEPKILSGFHLAASLQG